MDAVNQELLGKSKCKIDILLSFGADKELDTSLTKLVHFQIAKYRSNIEQIHFELSRFEDKYQMSSKDFYQRFESGKMGDEGDYFEWVGLYENVLLYNDRIRSLEAALKSD